ncbi:S1-C subfamily serine protease [Streptomyces pseudovenezuelae]
MGTAPSCGKVLEGTGFVFGDRRVMTNAHVVGGVDEPTVQIGGEGRKYDATVVLYDWERDIAVLDVPDLDAPALQFTSEDAASGDSAIVAGFPENGSYDVRSARVRGRIDAHGPDIYHRGTVNRDVYSLYATVRQGNSGGPLLTPQGKVYGVVFAKSLDDAGHRVRAHRGRDPGGHRQGAHREPAGGQRQLRAVRGVGGAARQPRG